MQNERQRRMAMLKAALPYTAPESRHAIELLLRADAFISLATHPPSGELSAADLDSENSSGAAAQANPEELLLHIQEFCTPRENDMLQMILNFMHAGKLFQKYRQFVHTHPDMTMASTSENNAGATANSPLQILLGLLNGLGALENGLHGSGDGSGNYMMEFLMSQLSPEQKATFEQLQNIMYTN